MRARLGSGSEGRRSLPLNRVRAAQSGCVQPDMSVCCVSGCNNRHSKSKFKFFRIPTGKKPFQVQRRRLWQRAIQRASNNSSGLTVNSRICGAHFISGEVSLDHKNVDFIPSVFQCIKKSPKKKVKRFISTFYGRRKRRYRKRNAGKEEVKSPPDPVDDHSPVLMETESEVAQELEAPPTPSVANGEETLTKRAEAEEGAETITSKTTSSPNKTSPSVPAFGPKLDKMNPVVLLKPLVLQDVYRLQLCNRNVPTVSQLVKEEQLDEEEKPIICQMCGMKFTNQTSVAQHQCVKPEEPSFPCNICDRTFVSSHGLKRHKLLHVKDGRKCNKCGVLFCRRHSHIPFQPATKVEDDSSTDELQKEDDNVMPENGAPKSDKSPAQSTVTVSPGLTTTTTVPSPPTITTTVPTPPTTIITTAAVLTSPFTTVVLTPPITTTSVPTHKFPRPAPCKRVPEIIKPAPPSASCPPPPVAGRSSNPDTSAEVVPPPKLPSSLQMFSPQCLTSALFQVERNYEYILSKSKDVKKEIKEEPCERPISPQEEIVEQVKYERIAYDLEIVV
nr:PREDICTED: zinc finger protein 135-like [Paralichthys olivaceus]